MTGLKLFLAAATATIFSVTIIAAAGHGVLWPVVFFGDLAALDWRSQFNADLLIYLCLLATWIVWREGATPRGYLFGVLSIFMGGMFGFVYLLHAIYKADGDPKRVLLGAHAPAHR